MVTVEEYLALERPAVWKSEFRNGAIVEMPQVPVAHVAVSTNAMVALHSAIKEQDFSIFMLQMRLWVAATRLFTYPDIAIVEGRGEFDDDNLINPKLIAEIFFDASEAYDRGEKFRQYRTLKSFTDYILISATQPLVEHFSRQSGGRWLYSVAEGREAVLNIPSLDADLPLAEIYHKVKLPGSES